MNQGHYVFSQVVKFLPRRYFERLVSNSPDRTQKWSFTHWNQLLVLMFGQLSGCQSLRELTDVLNAHYKKSYFLGFGQQPAQRSTLSLANTLRDYHVFETFAQHMVHCAQRARIDTAFELKGRFYAFDSTTIDLCMTLFPWAKFRRHKSGIKLHTQLDITTSIPVFYHLTNAMVHDVNAMDLISYEPNATYVFDRGYWDLNRLFKINTLGAYFIIRKKGAPPFEILEGEELLEGEDNVMSDQLVRFVRKSCREKYPASIRRIVYYAEELKRCFVYYTNCFYLPAKYIALLYKYRWKVELFFKWIKSHLRVKSFWGYSENAVRIQIYVAIITYCTVAILVKKLNICRSLNEVLRVIGNSLLTKDNIAELFSRPIADPLELTIKHNDYTTQLELDF